jgi:hypothetical protein
MTASGVEQQLATDGTLDRPALHPWRREHVGAGANGLAMRGLQAARGSGACRDGGSGR